MTPYRALTLRDMRHTLEGVIPPAMCTVSADGVPHVNYVSHAEYVDDRHIALSYQFQNRSRSNLLHTRRVAFSVDDPQTCASLVMQLEYMRTETSGPIFERLRANLAGIAAHSGMEKVFHLQGADVFRVLELRQLDGLELLPGLPPRCHVDAGARELSQRLADSSGLPELLEALTEGLQRYLCISHALLWLLDEQRQNLVLLASLGYAFSGVGAELALDDAGVAGVALREGVPIRIGHMAQMYRYGEAWRRRVEDLGFAVALEREIPLPALETPRSQVAVPLRAGGRTIGALLVESETDRFFSYDDEDALTLLGGQLAQALVVHQASEQEESVPGRLAAPTVHASPRDVLPIRVQHYAKDDSVFIDDQYIIKGVAGAILWKLASDYTQRGRSDFTSRELRLSGEALRLPELQDNLSVRLLLLERRLAERQAGLTIERTGRGRFRLVVDRPLLIDDSHGS